MSQQIINLGTADKGNGDVLRTAFTKVNENFAELYNHVSAGVEAGATAPTDPGEGDLWWDSESGRLYVYYGTAWVDASPVDGVGSTIDLSAVLESIIPSADVTYDLGSSTHRWRDLYLSGNTIDLGGTIISADGNGGLLVAGAGINSTNELVNGSHTVSLSSVGLTAFPAISNESLFIQASELGSANASIGISAKNSVIVTANILDTAKQWTFGTEGKLTLPAGTTYEYLAVPLTGHGDGLALLDFALVTDGVSAQWIAASPNPEGVGYSVGDTFTFDQVFLGIPGASVTIEVLTIGEGGSIQELGFSIPPLYPADIYRNSPINLQVGLESNRWTFGATGNLTLPNGGVLRTDGNNVEVGGVTNFNVEASGVVNIYTNDGAHQWQFGDDSTLSLPEHPGTPVLTIADVVTTPKIYRATPSNDPVAVRDAYSSWYGNEENFKLIVEQDELIRGSNFPWHGMPSWEAYPLILNWNGGGLPPSSSMAPAAKTAMDSYFLWKELESNIDIVSGNKTFSFENTGSLLLPGELTFADTANAKIVVGKLEEATWTFGGVVDPHALTWPDGTWQSSAFQGTATTAGGLSNAGAATVTVNPLGVNKVWTFGTDAVLTLPQAGKVSIEGITADNISSLETAYNDAEAFYSAERTTWMTVNNHTPTWYLLTGPVAYNEILDAAYTEPDWTGTAALESSALAAYTAYNAWQTAITNSKLTIKSATASWTFDSENKLTLSNGGVVAGGDAAAVQAAYTEWQSDNADWYYVITTGGADQNIRPWHFAGPSRAEKQQVLTAMWQAQQTLELGDTLGWVPISSAYYNEVRSWLALESSFDGYNEWLKLTTSVNITSEDKTWSFTNDGALTVPGTVASLVDEDLTLVTSYTPLTSPPGLNPPVDNLFIFGANGELTLPGGITKALDEDLVISTSYTAMSSPPGPAANTFTFGANGILTVPSIITSLGILSVKAATNSMLELEAPDDGYINIGVGTTEVTIGTQGNGKRTVIATDRFQILAEPPSTSKGSSGDYLGMIAFDNDYIYYCTNVYTDGVADIWKRTAQGSGTW